MFKNSMYAIVIAAVFINGCASKTKINSNQRIEIIENYYENSPGIYAQDNKMVLPKQVDQAILERMSDKSEVLSGIQHKETWVMVGGSAGLISLIAAPLTGGTGGIALGLIGIGSMIYSSSVAVKTFKVRSDLVRDYNILLNTNPKK